MGIKQFQLVFTFIIWCLFPFLSKYSEISLGTVVILPLVCIASLHVQSVSKHWKMVSIVLRIMEEVVMWYIFQLRKLCGQLSKVSWHNYSRKFLSIVSSSKTGVCWKLCGNSSVTLLANTVKLLWIRVEEYIYPLTSGGTYNWDSALIRMNIIYMKFTEHLELNICNTYDRIY